MFCSLILFRRRSLRRVLDNVKWVWSFVKTRVFSSGRQNIEMILEKPNLEKYDELDIFLAMNGRFTQDNFSIRAGLRVLYIYS